MFILPKKVTIIEVGPRDGLQNESKHIDVENKLIFIKKLQEAGITEMELTSFVSPKWVPQMRDADEIMQHTKKIGRQLVLAPNQLGAERAIRAGAKSVAVFVGVSNTFNQNNINRSTANSLTALVPVFSMLKEQGIFIRACVSTAFYCPYEGKIEENATVALCESFVTMGVDELSVADTVGMANPLESYTLFRKLKERFPTTLVTAHFHDTQKMAIANIFTALQAGVDRFDTSAGGLGGCPFAPGATGNVATEDVVHMLDTLQIESGIDVKKVCAAIKSIEPYVARPIQTGMYKRYEGDKN